MAVRQFANGLFQHESKHSSASACMSTRQVLLIVCCHYRPTVTDFAFFQRDKPVTGRIIYPKKGANMYAACLKKNCANLLSSELRQISTNCDKFWQKDGKEAKIMRGACRRRSSSLSPSTRRPSLSEGVVVQSVQVVTISTSYTQVVVLNLSPTG